MMTVFSAVISIVFGIDAVWVVFFSGLILDLVNIEPLGSHSLFFLIILWLVERYKKKIHIGAYLYPILFIFSVLTAEGLIFRRSIDYMAVISAAGAGIVMMAVLSRIFLEKVSDKKRLRV